MEKIIYYEVIGHGAQTIERIGFLKNGVVMINTKARKGIGTMTVRIFIE